MPRRFSRTSSTCYAAEPTRAWSTWYRTPYAPTQSLRHVRYSRMPRAVLTYALPSTTPPASCYAMCGTELAYGATSHYAASSSSGMLLRLPYALSSTELRYAPIPCSSSVRSAHASLSTEVD
eukprot:2670626-Rhodomonas_salina.1